MSRVFRVESEVSLSLTSESGSPDSESLAAVAAVRVTIASHARQASRLFRGTGVIRGSVKGRDRRRKEVIAVEGSDLGWRGGIAGEEER